MSSPVSILPKGSGFTRLLMSMGSQRGNVPDACEHAINSWGVNSPAAVILREATGSGNLTPGNWAEELISYSTVANEFWSLSSQKSVVGQLAGLRRTLLGTATVVGSSLPTAYWTSDGLPIPVSPYGFDRSPLLAKSCGAMIVVTAELLRASDPGGEALIRSDLAAALARAVDEAFLSPLNDGGGGIAPASVTFGIVSTAATASPAGDLAALITDFQGNLDDAYLIGDPVRLAAMAGLEFPNVGPRGGEIAGIPTISSKAATGLLVLIDPGAVAFGNGVLQLGASQNAAIQMVDNPTAGAAPMVSMWERNFVSLRGILPCGWRLVRPGVSFIQYAGA